MFEVCNFVKKRLYRALVGKVVCEAYAVKPVSVHFKDIVRDIVCVTDERFVEYVKRYNVRVLSGDPLEILPRIDHDIVIVSIPNLVYYYIDFDKLIREVEIKKRIYSLLAVTNKPVIVIDTKKEYVGRYRIKWQVGKYIVKCL